VREFPGNVRTNVQLKIVYKRFGALDQVSRKERGSGRPRTAGTEDNKAGKKDYVEDTIAFLRKMSPGLTKHKKELPRNSMSVKCLYPNWCLLEGYFT
jgi:hypothetical protein